MAKSHTLTEFFTLNPENPEAKSVTMLWGNVNQILYVSLGPIIRLPCKFILCDPCKRYIPVSTNPNPERK